MENTLKGLPKAELIKRLEQLQAEKAREAALNGVKIEYAEGINKQGKPWQNVSVSGGVFGWPGLKLTPAKFDRFAEIAQDVSIVIDNHRHKFE